MVAALCEVSQLIGSPQPKLQHPLESSRIHSQQSSWNNWINEFERSFTRQIACGSFVCIYIIRSDKEPRLKLFQARELKKGGYGKLTSNYEINHFPEIDQFLFSQIEASHLLKNKGHSYGRSAEYSFSSISFFSYMQQMIETRRCFLENNQTHPLSLGPPQTISFHWKVNDNEYYSLLPQVSNVSSPIVLPLKQPWYIDPEKSFCGPLSTDFPVEFFFSSSQSSTRCAGRNSAI